MKPFLGHIVLALSWVALTGDLTLLGFAVGLLVGFFALWIAADLIGVRPYTRRVRATFWLAGIVVGELFVANARLTRDIVTTKVRATPAIVGMDLRARGDMEILLIAVLITLTPGTVVVHITEDRRRMYVYGMYVRDPDAFRERLRTGLEERILAVTRGPER